MTYNDIINNNFILPKKEKYTLKDFKKLVNDGHTQLQARFICICSCIYYYYDTENAGIDHISKVFYTDNFTLKCKYNRAL